MSLSRVASGNVSPVLLALALAGLAAEGSLAQDTGTVSGTVTIAGRGEGMPGVRVAIPALGLESIVDMEGRYRFELLPPGQYEVRAEAIGCRAGSWVVYVPAGGRIDLSLAVDGPAFASRPGLMAARTESPAGERETPYTVERLEARDLERNPARHIGGLIRGAFPGAKVVQGSGLPGSNVSIQFRGPRSLSGSQTPLIVVDGAITGGGLDDLDPFDVERIAVLKGPAASAMYGARGQAGVIEITTKSGAATVRDRCFLRREPSSGSSRRDRAPRVSESDPASRVPRLQRG